MDRTGVEAAAPVLPEGWQGWPRPAQERLLDVLRQAAKSRNKSRRWATPGALAREFDARTVQTAALDLIDAELVRLADTPDGRLIVSMPPQEGKSQRASRRFPLWVLTQNPETRVAIASYEHGVARRWGRSIRDDILVFGDQLGLRVRDDLAAQHEWQLAGHEGGVYAVGIGGALTGRPVDLMVVDDPIKDRTQADSPTYRERTWDWWTDVAATRLAPGAPVVLILCIVAGMRVLRGDGRWIPIENMRAGDTVISLAEDRKSLVTAKVLGQKLSGQDETVTVRTDRLELRTNRKHPFAVLRRDKSRPAAHNIEWVFAGELRPGDRVVTAKSMPDDYVAIDTLQNGWAVTPEVAWLMGFMLGDGWITAHKRKRQAGNPTSYAVCCAAGTSSAPEKANLSERVQAALEAFSPNKVYMTSGKYWRTDWNEGGRLLQEMGYGAGARNKRVPACVWDWSPALRRSFLDGYVMADGTKQRANGSRAWRAVSVSRDLLCDVRDLALTCGVRPTRVFSDKPRTYQPPNSPEPIISVQHSLGLTFLPEEPEGRTLLCDYKHPNPAQLRYERIRSVDAGPVLPVYDLMVEGTESFVAEGFVVHNTRWHEDDLAGRLLAAEDGHLWRVVNIPAQADHDPSKGETDPLGREPGEFMKSARGRTRAQWEAIKVRSGSRTWASLYQGRPTPAAGDIFQKEWWREYTSPRWIERPDGSCWAPNAEEVCMSWDMAFKDTDGSDYVVGQVWARYGLELYLLDQVHERMSFTATCTALRDLAAKWPQATLKLVEDKANGTAVINSLSRQVSGLVPVEPDGSKEARARAVTPFIESGSVHLPAPELRPWVAAFRDEHAAFPNGSHDDQVDACTQAINRMLLAPILRGDLIVESDDLDRDLDEFEISAY